MKKKERAIVFGGSGFLGSHIADALTSAGYSVRIFDLQKSKYLQDSQEMIIGDILDIESVENAVKGCDYVYNFAGLADINDARVKPIQTANLNVIGTVHTLEAAKNAGVKRYVFASSVYVFSNQGSFYRASKQAAERYIETYEESFGLPYTILRYGSLYGKRADARNGIYRLLKEALTEKKIKYPGTGQELREYIHVTDAAESSVEILDEQYSNQHIMLTGNEKLKSEDLLKMISEVLGGSIELEFTNDEMAGHYTITPYSFSPKIGKKLVHTYHIDMGQGILECLAELHEDLEIGMSKSSDWLIKE